MSTSRSPSPMEASGGVTRASQEKGLLDTLCPLAAARAQPSPWLHTAVGTGAGTVICPRRSFRSCRLLFPTPSSVFNKRFESQDQRPRSWALGNGRTARRGVPIPTGTHSAATLVSSPWFRRPLFSFLRSLCVFLKFSHLRFDLEV